MPEESQTTRERIATLLSGYYKKSLDEDERQELEVYCRQIPEMRSILQSLDDEELVSQDLADLNESGPEVFLPMVLEKLDILARPRSLRSRIRQWATQAAAAVLIPLVIFCIYHMMHPPAEIKGLAVKNDQRIISSGRNVILTLFDGQSLLLDDMVNGKKWKKDGITILKTDNGHASYKADITAKGFPQSYNTLATPRGAQFVLTLPDSTRVWLNNASTISFPAAFHDGWRNVRLTGEAYFEVTKNNLQPFSVIVGPEGNEDTIQVLGTSFNVSAYANEPHIETTLLIGSIRVVRKGNTMKLKPGQQLISGRNGDWPPPAEVDTANIVAWKEGRFNFTGNDIFQAMRQLERWYDIQTEVRGPVLQRKFIATLDRQPLGDLLEELSVKRNYFHYKFEGRKLIVSP